MGVDFHAIFWLSGATIGALLLLVALPLFRNSPAAMGLPPVEQNEHRVVRGRVDTRAILSQLAASCEFWAVLLLSICCTTAREAFNTNSADLLVSQGAATDVAAALSSAFPLMGVPGCLFFGWLIDRYDRRRNGEIVGSSLVVLLLITVAMV